MTEQEKVDLEGAVYLTRSCCLTVVVAAILWILVLAGVAYLLFGRG
jgi:hypothetical protein